jgi:predicted N-formylglutamate amidohydrolase
MKLRPEASLLSPDEPAAAELMNPEGSSAFILLCDHASKRIPRQLKQLGLNDEQLHGHIAWDAGALAVATELSARLDAPLVQANYSRLVIDCNRALTSTESILTVSDDIVIAANQQIDDIARQRRQQEIFLPYHRTIEELLDKRRHPAPVLLSIHSFNPVIQGRPRPWEIGVCYGQDRRLADMFLERLPGVTDAIIGDNQPFDIDPAIDFTLPQHADGSGFLHVMLEIRRDCIDTPKQISDWGESIALVCLGIERTLTK